MMNMKISKLITVLYVGLTTMTALGASEGGISGGGGDYRPFDDGSAWFLGDRVIRVCTEVAQDFFPPGHVADVTGILETAFQTWETYIQSLHLNQFLPPKWPLALKRKFVTSCDGSEDLTIYFGIDNHQIRDASQRYVNPFAFVHRATFDPRVGWGKGFIWVAKSGSIDSAKNFPNWTDPNRLQGTLLHELGHVLGCEHVSGTIMQENIADLVLDNSNLNYQRARLTQIDGTKFLYSPNQQSYSGSVGVQEETTPPQETFRIFVGRNSVGKIRAKVQMDLAQKSISIELTDDIGKTSIPIQFNATSGPSLGTGSMAGNRIFHTVFVNDDGTVNSFYLPSPAIIFFGSAMAADGKPRTVSFEENMDGLYDPQIYGPISVWYYEMGIRKNLFSMSLPGA